MFARNFSYIIAGGTSIMLTMTGIRSGRIISERLDLYGNFKFTSFKLGPYSTNLSQKDFVYDDFIPRLGRKFNASQIMQTISNSGAQYFVPTTMHHDGFAIFDTKNSTNRSSVYIGPKRDFLKELFDDAKENHPHIHRGT
jgi:hypothetical protein